MVKLASISPDASPEEVAAIVAAISAAQVTVVDDHGDDDSLHEWVHAARANARVHLRVCDDDGNVIHEERAKSFVSDKRRRAVIRRDGRCRWPGCPHRRRLQVHHLHPSSWGGPDDIANLAAVCPYHHGLLIPTATTSSKVSPTSPTASTSVSSRRWNAGNDDSKRWLSPSERVVTRRDEPILDN